MKLLILVLLSSSLVRADNYFALGKLGANTAYSQKDLCEKLERAECFQIDKCPSDECGIEVRQVEECSLDSKVCQLVDRKFVVPDAAKLQIKADAVKAIDDKKKARDVQVEEMKALQKNSSLDPEQQTQAIKFLLDEAIK